MSKYQEYNTGDIVGTLIYLNDEPHRYNSSHTIKYRMCKFKCYCGREFVAFLSNVKKGTTKSCGCYNDKLRIERNTKHNLCKHPLYLDWQNIKHRCYYTKLRDYKYYGGKGIEVCDSWKNNFIDFYNWSINNGWKKELTIDRIDGNGNYEPNNCRWITNVEQCRNRKSNINIVYGTEKFCLLDLCTKLDLNYRKTLARVRRYKWPIEKAIDYKNNNIFVCIDGE